VVVVSQHIVQGSKSVFLKFQFPASAEYPFVQRIINLDPNQLVSQAITHIQRNYELPPVATIGLYCPGDKIWLEDDARLCDYKFLLKNDEYVVEYKDRKEQLNLGDIKHRRYLLLACAACERSSKSIDRSSYC
jgi:hypothetical protein